MQMLDETGQTIRNDTMIGPLSEGQQFVSYCEARGGRPKPNVGWHLNGKRLPGAFQPFFVRCLFSHSSLHFIQISMENKK